MRYTGLSPASRLGNALSVRYDPIGESSEDHRDRLFLQVLFSLMLNIFALLVVFYFMLPTSESGRVQGGVLLWSVLGISVGITALFLQLGRRVICVNLLLILLSCILIPASFVLGGVMSPTMIFMLALPVLAGTLMHARWAFLWTAVTVTAWLAILILESSGYEMTRITDAANVGIVQVIALLGTVLIVMAVLGSYVSATNRLRKAMEQQNQRLDYLASHDPLTSVPNRRMFFEHAQECLLRSTRSQNPFALLVIDLNDFKQINDELGHKVGDAVLLHFAQRLSNGFRDTDFIGRLGGDEFAVLLEPADKDTGIAEVMARFRSGETNEVQVDGKTVPYDYAVGTAIYPGDGETVLELYEAADASMYRSKKGVPPSFLWK